MIAEARSPPVVRDVHFSYSAMSLYLMCPLRYMFRYLEGLPEDTISASLVCGSGIHSALQLHFTELLCGNPPPSLDLLLDAFWEPWRSLASVQVRFNKGEDINDIGQLAERVLRAFQASELARPQGTIIGVEEPVRGELVPGVPDLVGRIDLLVETDEALILTDFKSARSAWSPDHVEDAGNQLLIYGELARPLASGKQLRLEFAVLTKGKVPEVSIHPVEADAHRIDRTKRVVENVWKSIADGRFYPVPSPMNCPTCPYRVPCRAWTG